MCCLRNCPFQREKQGTEGTWKAGQRPGTSAPGQFNVRTRWQGMGWPSWRAGILGPSEACHPLVSRETLLCSSPWPGSVGNLELNQILLLKSLQKGLEKWNHLLYVDQQKILELPPCSVVLKSSCTLESPVELLKRRDVCALLQSSCNPNLCESTPREETRCLLGPREQRLH